MSKENEPRLLYEGFARDIAQTLPLVFTESLSYVQCIYLLYRKVNEIISVLNNIAEIVERFEDFQLILSRWDRYIEKIYFSQIITVEKTFRNVGWLAKENIQAMMYRDMDMPIHFTINTFNTVNQTRPIQEPAGGFDLYYLNTDGEMTRISINSATVFPLEIETNSSAICVVSSSCVCTPLISVKDNQTYNWEYFGMIPAYITVEDGSTILNSWLSNNSNPAQYAITNTSFVYDLWSTKGNLYLSTDKTPSIIFELQYRDDIVIKFYLPHPYQIDLSGSIGNTVIYFRDEELITITVDENNKIVPVATYKNIIFDVTMNRFEVLHGSLRPYTDPVSEARVHRVGGTREQLEEEVNL